MSKNVTVKWGLRCTCCERIVGIAENVIVEVGYSVICDECKPHTDVTLIGSVCPLKEDLDSGKGRE